MDGKKIVRGPYGIEYYVDEDVDWDSLTYDEQEVWIILGDAIEVEQ